MPALSLLHTIALALIAIPVLVYGGYPAIVILASGFARRRPAIAARTCPSLTILICAHNEADTIAAKLDSVLSSVALWPGDCEVVVGDDASTDTTAAIVAGYALRGVRLERLPRGGKAAALNALIPQARGDILVLTDADPLFEAGTLDALIAPFADPAIGAVAGRVETIREGAHTSRFAGADRWFRAYESAIRRAEDRLFGCIAADGGLFAIRRALVPTVPGDVTDDFYISTAAVAAGLRIAQADDARVWEHSIAGHRQQWRRRVRITVRGMTALWRRRALMNPARTGWYAVALVLHKLGRRLAPVVVAPLAVVALLLAGQGDPFGLVLTAGLIALAAFGWLGIALAPRKLPGPLAALHAAVLHLAAMTTGVLLFASGRRFVQWTPQKAAQ